MPSSDEVESTGHLIARARTGDAEAVAQLCERHLLPLQRWARGRLPHWARDVADTDDLVQDALIQTFRRIEAFEPRHRGGLQAYLRQAVLNRIRDELRRSARRPPSGDSASQRDPGLSPLEQAIGREALERYECALAALSPEEREAIIGRLEMGYTYQELADLLPKPSADAARKACERALLRLAGEMRHARR